LRLIDEATKQGNEYLVRKFREKLIASIAYAIQQAAAELDKHRLQHLLNKAKELRSKFGLTELDLYIELGEKELKRITELRKKQGSGLS